MRKTLTLLSIPLILAALSHVACAQIGAATSFQSLTADPSTCPSPPNNQVWYNSTKNLYSSCPPGSSSWPYQRFSQSIDFDRYAGFTLRNWRGQLSAIRQNVGNSVAVLACIGDSLTAGSGLTVPGYCSQSLMYYLWGKYGFAGSGWLAASSFGQFNLAPPGTSLSAPTGVWTAVKNTDGGTNPSYGPDDTAEWNPGNHDGDTFTFNCGTVSTLPCTQMVLYLGLPPNSGGSGGIDCQVGRP